MILSVTRGAARWRRLLGSAVLVGSGAAGLVLAADAEPARGGEWFPGGSLYPVYLADIESTESLIAIGSVPDTGVADSGSPRPFLKLGGPYGIYRRDGVDWPFDWQLTLSTGFSSQFDIDNSYDGIGWDGRLGLSADFDFDGGLAVRVGAMHNSSHLGDEYAERTGRTRIEYTREEYLAGVSWEFGARWRVYGEGGYAYTLNNPRLQERLRTQTGLEFVAPEGSPGGRARWYAATNLTSFQERDWQIDWSVEWGVLVRSEGRQWRLGLTVYSGSVPIGEFFQDDETYVILGGHLNP